MKHLLDFITENEVTFFIATKSYLPRYVVSFMCRCFLFVFFSSSNKQWRRQNRNNKQCINKHMESRRFVLLFFICTLFENSICLASYPASCQFCIRKMVLCMLRCYSSLDAHRSIPIVMPKNSIMFEIRYQVYYMRRFS